MEQLAAKRIMQEYRDFNSEREKLYPDIQIIMANDDIHKWYATISGPEGTDFQCKILKFVVTIPNDYPSNPPEVIMQPPIYHLNIAENGKMNLQQLQPQDWKRNTRIVTALRWAMVALQTPQPLCAVDNKQQEYENMKDIYETKFKSSLKNLLDK